MNISYIVYKTTNLVNGKIYIGAHRTKNIGDAYIGSGILFLKALKKYGYENFKKEILYVYQSEDEMFAKEAELVTEEFVSLDTNYNIELGGRGLVGRSKSIRKRISASVSVCKQGKKLSESHKKSISASHTGKVLSEAHKLKISESCKGRTLSSQHIERLKDTRLKGVPRSDSEKESMRAAFINTPDKVCPHCGKSCKPAPYKRWHGDNCRMKELV